MKRIPITLFAAAMLSLAGCTNDSKTTVADIDAAMDDTMADTLSAPATPGDAMGMDGTSVMVDPNGPTAPHATDEEFMKSAAHSDQNEIQLSQMALRKGVSGEAKAMADRMIADHSKSTADLQAIAARKNVTLPTDMDAEHKAMVPMLEKLSTDEFAARYMAQMGPDHQKTANTMAAHELMTQDADIKAFIAKTLPVVKQHLHMAKMDMSDPKM